MNHKVTDLSSPVMQCLVTFKAHALIMFDNPDYLWFQLTTLDAAVIVVCGCVHNHITPFDMFENHKRICNISAIKVLKQNFLHSFSLHGRFRGNFQGWGDFTVLASW